MSHVNYGGRLASTILADLGIHVAELLDGKDRIFKNISVFERCADTLLGDEEARKSLYVYENTISSLHDSCKPEIFGNPVVKQVAVFQYLRGVVESVIEQQDIHAVANRIAELLDESLVVDSNDAIGVAEDAGEYKIFDEGKFWDLSKIDFEKLKAEFKM